MSLGGEIVSQVLLGQLSVDEGYERLAALSRETAGAAPSAHQVAEAEDETQAVAPERFNPYLVPGDPSAGEYARLSVAQAAELERVRPGVADRLRAAAEWDAASSRQAATDRRAAELLAFNDRFLADPAFAQAQLAARAREDLDARWWQLSEADRTAMAIEAGVSPVELAEMAEAKRKLAAERFGVAS